MAKPTSIRNSFKSNKICFRATQPNKLSLYMLFATHRAHSLFFNDKLFFLSINSVQTSWGFIKTDLCVVRGHAVQKTNLNAKCYIAVHRSQLPENSFQVSSPHFCDTTWDGKRNNWSMLIKIPSLQIDK